MKIKSILGQAAILQSSERSPTQSAPPLAPAGLSQVLVFLPVPQVASHAPQSLNPPSTATA